MKGWLVERDTAQDRRAVGFVRQARNPERRRPAGIEMAADADLIGALVVASGCCWMLGHGVPGVGAVANLVFAGPT